MGLSGETVEGGGRAVDLLLECAGTEEPGEYPVLCRSQFATVGFLVGSIDQRADGLWNSYTVLVGRLAVMPAAIVFSSNFNFHYRKPATS